MTYKREYPLKELPCKLLGGYEGVVITGGMKWSSLSRQVGSLSESRHFHLSDSGMYAELSCSSDPRLQSVIGSFRGPSESQIESSIQCFWDGCLIYNIWAFSLNRPGLGCFKPLYEDVEKLG